MKILNYFTGREETASILNYAQKIVGNNAAFYKKGTDLVINNRHHAHMPAPITIGIALIDRAIRSQYPHTNTGITTDPCERTNFRYPLKAMIQLCKAYGTESDSEGHIYITNVKTKDPHAKLLDARFRDDGTITLRQATTGQEIEQAQAYEYVCQELQSQEPIVVASNPVFTILRELISIGLSPTRYPEGKVPFYIEFDHEDTKIVYNPNSGDLQILGAAADEKYTELIEGLEARLESIPVFEVGAAITQR